MPASFTESRERLWVVPAAPLIWGVHFLATYITAALWCGRWAGPSQSLGPARMAIAVYTLVALTLIAAIGRYGFRAQADPQAEPPHDDDSPEDRHRFLGLATLLLSGLSALAVIYSGLAVWLSGTCL